MNKSGRSNDNEGDKQEKQQKKQGGEDEHTLSRREMIKKIWIVGLASLFWWSVWWLIEGKSTSKEYILNVQPWDTARWLLQTLYTTLDIDKKMALLYTDERIKESVNNEQLNSSMLTMVRFNIFFIALQSNIYFLQENEKDIFTWYKPWDTIRIIPSQVLSTITADPDIRWEERILRLRTNAQSKWKNKQWEWHWQSITEIRDAARSKKNNEKTDTKKEIDTDKPSQKRETSPPHEEIKKRQTDSSQKRSTLPQRDQKDITRPAPPSWKNKNSSYAQRKKYIKDYEHIARTEMKKYDIPASIKLAQGILESRHGRSELTQETNNHFGMKCRTHTNQNAKTWKRTKHYYIDQTICCANRKDDHAYDMFKAYNNAWSSFRHHSSLLAGTTRYAFLTSNENDRKEREKHFSTIYSNQHGHALRKNQRKNAYKYRSTPHKKRAYGLAAMGYATSPTYPEKLIKLIDERNLTQFDR
jgi:flagellum-specific peptidoglycan hydrolase FlgJ